MTLAFAEPSPRTASMQARVRAPASDLTLSRRDRQILERASRKLRGVRVDFGEALRALREAVEESIPGGRVFFLGTTDHGPIIGSVISGIGISDHPAGVQIVRARPGDPHVILTELAG